MTTRGRGWSRRCPTAFPRSSCLGRQSFDYPFAATSEDARRPFQFATGQLFLGGMGYVSYAAGTTVMWDGAGVVHLPPFAQQLRRAREALVLWRRRSSAASGR